MAVVNLKAFDTKFDKNEVQQARESETKIWLLVTQIIQ